MTDDAKTAAMARLRRAANRVRKHDDERKELAAAIIDARESGWRPKQIQDEVPYDRNHVGRIFKAAGLTHPRGEDA